MLLLDGTSALRDARYTAPIALDGSYGGHVVDLHGTAAKGMVAVMIAGQLNQTYGISLEGWIEVSDALAANWKRVASFLKFYQWRRKVPAKTTTAPVEADVGRYLYGGTTTDDAIITCFDPELFVSGGKGNIYVAMVASDDLFDNAADALTCDDAIGGSGGGTFVGVSTAKSVLLPGGGIFTCRFATKKRYARFNLTIDGNFQRVMVALTPYPFDDKL